MKVVVGLGNPGAQYANTPHSVGFEVVDRISVAYKTDDDKVKTAFNGKDLKRVVLADSITEGETDGFKKELDVNGINVTVTIAKK